MPKRYRQLRVKDLPKVRTRRLEWDSNLRPSGRKAPNLPLTHQAPQCLEWTINEAAGKLKFWRNYSLYSFY